MSENQQATLLAHAHPWDDPCTEACPAHRAALLACLGEPLCQEPDGENFPGAFGTESVQTNAGAHHPTCPQAACPPGPHWCQNPENPAGYAMHVPAGAFRHDPYAAQRSHAHCWHGNQSHPDPSCCLCDGNGCRKANGRAHTEETPTTATDEKSEGLLPKYRVERGSDPTGKHADCRYFVLDPQHDPLAWRALALYAALARIEGYEALGADLQGWLDDLYDPAQHSV